MKERFQGTKAYSKIETSETTTVTILCMRVKVKYHPNDTDPFLQFPERMARIRCC